MLSIRRDPKCTDGPLYIGDFMLAEIPKNDRQTLADLVTHRSADRYPARLGQAFQAGCDCHRIPIDPVAMPDHVANRYAHTKLDLPLRRGLDRRRPHRVLNGERAYDGVDGTAKLDDETVAHPPYQPSLAFLNARVDDVAPDRRESGVRTLFIRAHQPRIADNICTQDDSNSIFNSGCAHRPSVSRSICS